jgi:transcriptional regulator of acetoin/glycerol metabolism
VCAKIRASRPAAQSILPQVVSIDVRTLRAVSGNKAAAARVLGLSRKTLYRKLTHHRISAARLFAGLTL